MKMTVFDEDLFQWLGIVFMWVSVIFWGRSISKRMNNLEEGWKIFLQQRIELYKHLGNPFAVEEEMEIGARRREMYDANRTTLPREDSGPPAVVHRPPQRAQKPGPPYYRPAHRTDK